MSVGCGALKKKWNWWGWPERELNDRALTAQNGTTKERSALVLLRRTFAAEKYNPTLAPGFRPRVWFRTRSRGSHQLPVHRVTRRSTLLAAGVSVFAGALDITSHSQLGKIVWDY